MVTWLRKNRSCRVLLVEKTDRLYRNFRDAVTLEDLDIEIHLVKEGQIISKDSKSQAKFVHGINVVVARNYSDNLKEEVKKGMLEKARQGVFPGLAPFGYRNDKATRTIEIDPVDSPMVTRLMEAYATGAHTLSTLRKMLKTEFGKTMSKGGIDWVLKNRFYIGEFEWGGETHLGSHPLFIERKTFEAVQAVFAGHHRPKYGSQEIAFRGLVNCAYDGCAVTGEIKKGKYVYYRCTGYHGKCDLPRFKEEELAARLGEPLKHLQVPREIVEQIVTTLREDQKDAASKVNADRSRLEGRLTAVRNRMDAAYIDKLDGKISEEFWERKMADWRMEEQHVKLALDALANAATEDRALSAERTLELANKAYLLYVRRIRSKRPNCSECYFRTARWTP
jgi:hypothetical protein